MPVMAVNNENQHEQTGDYRSRPRWSAGKKTDAVLRLLGGEPLEVLSRELGMEAHRLAAWRDDFLQAGKQGLKGQRADRTPDDRALKQAERKIGQLTMENEVLRAAAEKGSSVVKAGPERAAAGRSGAGGRRRRTTGASGSAGLPCGTCPRPACVGSRPARRWDGGSGRSPSGAGHG
jgi:transposase-like protein